MAANTAIANAIERLDYRVTVGDVAAQAGTDLDRARRGLLELASEAGGHLQVAESGEIAYTFPRNFRAIRRNQSLRLQLQAWWNQVWGVLFYLIRISFGIMLLLSILLMVLAIAAIAMGLRGGGDDEGGGDGPSMGGGLGFPTPLFLIGPDPFWIFAPDWEERRHRQRERSTPGRGSSRMNFLEAVFSFLFGDGNPNADLEARRWRTIAAVIRNNGGTAVAEQVAPYLDDIAAEDREDEDFMLPVLARFNGYPEVSEGGSIVYCFPDLQVTATQRDRDPVPAYLKEQPWRFSEAGRGQLVGAIGLGGLNLVLALMLGSLLQGPNAAAIAQAGGFLAFIQSIYGLLLAYAISFLAVPLGRYYWIRWRNRSIEANNQMRAQRAQALNRPDAALRQKLTYARQFADRQVLAEQEAIYTSDRDLAEQESERADRIDEEWRRRLGSDWDA
ncbi:MAG: hypothetical protein BRC58_01940 [Cyanobacteria bacterium QS_8_64_29]|nr:MAG: hypothetical protein BRC58_01940 [Cyanobacteria bacterium QS_8_64_29]